LLRLEEQEHWLLLTMHHIVSDGWSMGVLLREIRELYGAGVRGEESQLAELPIQYADYAVWQREWLSTGGVAERQLSYWREQLRGVGERVTQIGGGGVRRAVQRYEGGREEVVIGAEVVEGLREVGRAGGATLFMVLLASFKVLVMRYSGEEEVVVGTPVANRNRVETEGLIGFFVNMLTLRTKVRRGWRFEQVLSEVREVALGGYANQDVPFERVVEELAPERSLSHHPLFQVVFVLQGEVGELELEGLEVELEEVHDGTAKYEMLMTLREEGGEVRGAVEYNTDLFDLTFVRSFIDSFRALLAAFAANPSLPVSAAPLLSPEQRRLLLQHSNQTPSSSTPHLCLHQLFEQQVKRTPQAIALHCAGRSLSYEELERRANQLAHYLRGRGVGVEQVVGISMERGVEMVVAVLGVLKAGGAYLPLDVREPVGRLVQMVEEAGARLVLTSGGEDGGRWEEEVRVRGVEVVRVDGEVESEEIGVQSEEGVESGVREENLAYVIYTSGSTGSPKGIAMPHYPVNNLMQWQLKHTSLPQGAKTLQFASLNFDVSLQEFFLTWMSGGSLFLISEKIRREPKSLLRFIADNSIERLFLPVVAIQQLAEVSEAKGIVPEQVREIIIGGEQLLINDKLLSFIKKLDGCELHNHYGPSECHVVTDLTLRGAPDDWPVVAPIGYPIDNLKIYLLDSNLEPVPAGMAGEVYIGGRSQARGYYNRPDLTAERFIPDPFGAEPGGRLYRTGDMARVIDGGALVFIGRVDHQVKVRGVRMELGEIEAALAENPLVKTAVVMTREDQSRNKYLVAFVVPVEGATPTVENLRNPLKEQLPDYMLPTAFVLLDELPVNTNGKADRRKLAEMEVSQPKSDVVYVAPRTEFERRIAAVWQEVLEVAEVGVDDNFFDLGGHSLLMAQVQAKLEEIFQREIPMMDLFRYSTVGSLARYLSEENGAAPSTAEREGRSKTFRDSARRRRESRQSGRARRSRQETPDD
jgi:amino acid adenylation domain-containing protein